MNLTQKISQMTPKGADLEATDLIEVSTIVGGSYVTKSITGQELIDAIPAPSGFVPTSRTLTINGVAQDLSADRSWTIATGLTVGTTPIASGTNGRVLFQGTGNVLQQSSSLFWDSTNNRLGIGTSTPLTSLEVNSLRATISIRDTTNVSNPSYFGSFDDFLQMSVNRNPSTGVYNNSAKASAQISIEGSTSSGKILFYTTNTNGATPLEAMRINGTGNVLINTTTDAGFKLDVNGTARVSDNLLLTNGIIATSTATTRLQGSLNYFTHNRIGSSGALGFQISQTGTLSSFWRWTDATNDVEFGNARNASLSLWTNNTVKATITGGGNVLINTTTDAGFKLDVNGTARVSQTLRVNGTGTATLIDLAGNGSILQHSTGYIFKSSSAANMLTVLNNFVGVNSITDIPSAVLAADSTTRGFLPPRMTTTQKNAIASPATGLQVYDTTLNQMSYYNGTTWTNI